MKNKFWYFAQQNYETHKATGADKSFLEGIKNYISYKRLGGKKKIKFYDDILQELNENKK